VSFPTFFTRSGNRQSTQHTSLRWCCTPSCVLLSSGSFPRLSVKKTVELHRLHMCSCRLSRLSGSLLECLLGALDNKSDGYLSRPVVGSIVRWSPLRCFQRFARFEKYSHVKHVRYAAFRDLRRMHFGQARRVTSKMSVARKKGR
jgi:hypothetical protein